MKQNGHEIPHWERHQKVRCVVLPGHGAITFLARIGAMETPTCCMVQHVGVVIHLYTECRRWRKERKKLSKIECAQRHDKEGENQFGD